MSVASNHRSAGQVQKEWINPDMTCTIFTPKIACALHMTTSITTGKRARPARDIPHFALYGEPAKAGRAEFAHNELIETRSRLYDWHIRTHVHRGLFQVLFLFGGRVTASIGDTTWERTGPVAITIHPSLVHRFDFFRSAGLCSDDRPASAVRLGARPWRSVHAVAHGAACDRTRARRADTCPPGVTARIVAGGSGLPAAGP